jgi:uncharacterized membrane protein YoaK (UPF0700 family)
MASRTKEGLLGVCTNRRNSPDRPDAEAPASRLVSWALLACAGWTDAVGFVMFSGLFVSFMSGDTTQLGVDLAHGNLQHVAKFAAPPALFVLGAAIGRLVVHWTGDKGRAAVLIIVAILLAFAAGRGLVSIDGVTLAAAVLAMGILNSAMHEANGVPVGTMITGALVRLGESLADLALRRPSKAVDNAGQWLAFLIAVFSGTLAFSFAGPRALAVPAMGCAALALAAARARGLQAWGGSPSQSYKTDGDAR